MKSISLSHVSSSLSVRSVGADAGGKTGVRGAVITLWNALAIGDCLKQPLETLLLS